MSENVSNPTIEPVYEIECASCGLVFDAMKANTCECLNTMSTPVCPSCGSCWCARSKEELSRFWRGAPTALWQRRLEQGGQSKAVCLNGDAPLRRPLVLVADDEPVTRCMAKRLIEKMGYGVVTAADGKEALRLAMELKPDLILSDVLMPGLDGRELARAVKEMPGLDGVKVFLMTSIFTKGTYKREALTAFRCDGFLKKPISANTLRELCTQNLGRQAEAVQTESVEPGGRSGEKDPAQLQAPVALLA
jgi:CheY-like chemotaxis protein